MILVVWNLFVCSSVLRGLCLTLMRSDREACYGNPIILSSQVTLWEETFVSLHHATIASLKFSVSAEDTCHLYRIKTLSVYFWHCLPSNKTGTQRQVGRTVVGMLKKWQNLIILMTVHIEASWLIMRSEMTEINSGYTFAWKAKNIFVNINKYYKNMFLQGNVI